MNNAKLLTSFIKKKEYEVHIKNEGLPLLRFDSQYLLNLNVYENFLQRFKANRVNIVSFEELGTLRKGQEKSDGVKALGIMVKSISKLSIHPLKLELKSVSKNSLVTSQNLAIISTGIGSIGRSGIVPRYLINDLAKEIIDASLPFGVTQHIIKFEVENKDISPYYIIALLNSYYGKLLIEGIATYGATGQLEVHVETLSRLKLPIIDIHKSVASIAESAIEDYEAKAWRAYFRAMKIVEEHFGTEVEEVSGISSYKEVRTYGRLDPKFYIYLNALRRLSKAQILRANELFDVKLGTAPRSREYKSIEQGTPYVSYNAIDDSGFIDEELFYRLPNLPKTTAKARKFGILITSVAHSVEGIGKVGMLYPYDDMPCMTGLAILNPSDTKLRTVAQKINYLKEIPIEDFMLYTFALLKSSLMRKVMQTLTYGLTAQISKKDIENLPIPLIKDLLDSDIASLSREFVENMYQANSLKRKAIAELEKYLIS